MSTVGQLITSESTSWNHQPPASFIQAPSGAEVRVQQSVSVAANHHYASISTFAAVQGVESSYSSQSVSVFAQTIGGLSSGSAAALPSSLVRRSNASSRIRIKEITDGDSSDDDDFLLRQPGPDFLSQRGLLVTASGPERPFAPSFPANDAVTITLVPSQNEPDTQTHYGDRALAAIAPPPSSAQIAASASPFNDDGLDIDTTPSPKGYRRAPLDPAKIQVHQGQGSGSPDCGGGCNSKGCTIS